MNNTKLAEIQARGRQLTAMKAEQKAKAKVASYAYSAYLDSRNPVDRQLKWQAYQEAKVANEILKDLVARTEKQFYAKKAGK